MCASYLKFKKISMPSDILESTLRKMNKYIQSSQKLRVRLANLDWEQNWFMKKERNCKVIIFQTQSRNKKLKMCY